MNLFTRKMHLFCVSNIMVSFVCTGFLGINGYNATIEGTEENAHEISLIASDTEPVSQKGEGEENIVSFVNSSIKIMVDEQKEALNEKKTVNNIIAKSNAANSNKTTNNTTKSTKKTTNVVTKKEVKNTVSYAPASYSSVTGEAIVNYAKKYLGLRYKSGTPSLTNGADCSGFTMLIYREFGVSLPRTVGGQIGRGTYVNKSDLQKGDLVFYKAKGSKGGASHVGIYIGSGQVIHESRPGVGVKISSVNMMQYVTARRVINSTAKAIAEQKLEEQKKNETIADTSSNNESTNKENVLASEQVENNNVAIDNNVIVPDTNVDTPQQDTTSVSTTEEVVETKESNETISENNPSQ